MLIITKPAGANVSRQWRSMRVYLSSKKSRCLRRSGSGSATVAKNISVPTGRRLKADEPWVGYVSLLLLGWYGDAGS